MVFDTRPCTADNAAPYGKQVAVSTHSRPKAAGYQRRFQIMTLSGFNTQPPEGGWSDIDEEYKNLSGFQHTAARRRLGVAVVFQRAACGFNTQPPEGGWAVISDGLHYYSCFNTQPPEGG